MQQQHRSTTRTTAEICELALAALVVELAVSHSEAAAILLAETSKHLTPGAPSPTH
jgi:hypothetical protein